MRLLYTLYCAVVFIGIYLLLFPLQFICLQRDDWKPTAHRINRWWGQLFFFVVGMPVRVEYQFKPDPTGVYVLCANHFSYIDIATMGVIVDNYYAFVGKSGVKKIPLLGYMFAKLHIQVDRARANSRAYSLAKSMRLLEGGRSVMIFPEGGIWTKNPPQMVHPFKDGAFTMAILQQVPIVPITLLNNYQILPDTPSPRVHRRAVRAVIHAPISTIGLTQADVPKLREETYKVIDDELKNLTARRLGQQHER